MPVTQTIQQSVEIARAFSHGVPVQAGLVEMTSDTSLNLNFILTFDDNTFPIVLPYPRLAVFDAKGAQLVSIPFSPGVTGWDIERPASGRIGWRLPGDHPGFAIITSLHTTPLEYRILGFFQAQREITILKGTCRYTRLSDDAIPPPPPGEDEELGSALEMFLQFKSQNPYFFTEYTWAGNGDLTFKRHYDSPLKTVLLFTSIYDWSGSTGLLETKTIIRASDNEQLVLHYGWDVEGTLETIERGAT